ncbi:hypothetical protein ACWY4P_03335 [Streptomyces sp. LZ34]
MTEQSHDGLGFGGGGVGEVHFDVYRSLGHVRGEVVESDGFVAQTEPEGEQHRVRHVPVDVGSRVTVVVPHGQYGRDQGRDLGPLLGPDAVVPRAARPGIGAEQPVQGPEAAPSVDLGAGAMSEPETAPRSAFDGLPAVQSLVELTDLLLQGQLAEDAFDDGGRGGDRVFSVRHGCVSG